ncbi:MAG TPA: glycosyltransferase family 4 protein [Rhodothermales bacterium]|nr:glycosyltransferase family 4 protein [Rhodothermales bacterium]
MRILYVSHSFPSDNDPDNNIGGMQRVAIDIYEAFKNHEQVVVFPLILKTSWNTTHIRAPFFLISLFWKIPALVRAHKIESVFFSALVTGWVTLFMRKRLQKAGVKTFVMLYGRDILLPAKLYQWALPKILGKVDAFFPISTATAEEALKRNFPADRTFVVPMGIDLSRIGVEVSKSEARAVLMETYPAHVPRPFIICSVGRHVKRKGFTWFADKVMPLLPDHVEYWAAGDGAERAALEAAVVRNSLQKRVKLLGRVSDEALETLYQGADLYVMPNIHVPGDMEGFGVVMLEAGICGLPVVAARLEGIRDVVHEGQNGHLVQSEDPQAFVDAIMPYVEDEQHLKAASERARAYVPKTFSWHGVAQQFVDRMAQVHRML